MVRKADVTGRRRRKKVKRKILCPPTAPPSCFPTLSSFIFVTPCGGVSLAFGLGECVLFLWVCFAPDCGPPGRKGPGCRCELGRQQGTELHIVLGVLGERGLQSDPASCHHRTTLSTVTASPPPPPFIQTYLHTHSTSV